eukprot:6484144-Amphidinium_carterae.1
MEEVAVSSSVPSGDALASALVGGNTEAAEDAQLAPEDVPDEVELVNEQPSKRKKTQLLVRHVNLVLKVFNLDETSCKILLLSEQAWTKGHPVGLSKPVTLKLTAKVTPIVSLGKSVPWRAQIIFKGQTLRGVVNGYSNIVVDRAASKTFVEDCLANPSDFSIAVGLVANRLKPPMCLPEAMEFVMQRDSIHNKAWRPFLEEPLDDPVQKAKEAKELGTLFVQEKGI